MNIQLILNKNSNHTSDGHLFCTRYADYEKIASCGYLELPSLENTQRDDFILYQNRLVDSLREENNKSEVFMSSPLGCQNTWQSDFFVGLESFFRLKNAIKAKKNMKLVFYDCFWYLVTLNFLKSMDGIEILYSWRALMDCHLRKIKLVISQTYRFYDTFRYMFNISMPLSRRLKSITNTHKIIFLSVWSGSVIQSFLKNNCDPYFKDIPYFLKKTHMDPVVFCHVDNFNKKHMAELSKIKSIKVLSYFNFLSLMDLFLILKQLLFYKLKTPKPYQWLELVMKADLRKKIWIQSCQALMVKYALDKFLRKNKGAKIVHIYEGNCWEKGCVMAARKANQSSTVIGYQHTGLSVAYPKLRDAHYLMPDMILTTGEVAKKILVNNFKHQEEKVRSMCALRQDIIYTHSPKNILPGAIKRVLILLQGSPFDRMLMEHVGHIRKEYTCDITVRQHPAYKIPNIENIPWITMSKESTLYQELLACDIVIHSGTTAALEAVYLGVPCVFVDVGVAAVSDPLFQIKNNLLVQRLKENENFSVLIENMLAEKENFDKNILEIRQYFDKYFEEPSEEKFFLFINLLLESHT